MTETNTSKVIKKRYDFVLFFDVQDGNPNGDPDAGNLPRMDPETSLGLVSDVCLKRKIRNYVQVLKAGEPGYDIFIREGAVLNRIISETCAGLGSKGKKASSEEKRARSEKMCQTFFDVRTFGAVLTTNAESSDSSSGKGKKDAKQGKEAKDDDKLFYSGGQVRGPVQITFARSIDPIMPLDHAITRMAVTNESDEQKERTMGRKNTISYGLYRAHGFIVPSFAVKTGFSDDDLAVLWEALRMMFNEDPSSSHGTMATRRLIVFEHKSALGNAPAAELFDRVTVTRNNPEVPARGFSDYTINVDTASLPPGVSCWQK